MIRVDGGMVASDWTMQFLADMLHAPVDRPKVLETTALGAAYLAGYRAGLYPAPAAFARELEAGKTLHAEDARAGAGGQICRLAGCGGAHAQPAVLRAD